MKSLMVLAFCSLVLSGLTACEVMGPSVKVEPPRVRVDGVVVEGQGKHCPPGQAKKGRC